MSPRPFPALLALLLAVAPAARGQMHHHAPQADAPAGDPHLLLTPRRAATPADSARAAALVVLVRDSLARYRDVAAAEADGYRRFLPGVAGQRVHHFVHRRWSRAARRRFDPTRPSALLYRDADGGGLELVGVMYTAPAEASLETLDARVPLAIAPWHRHVNLCLPPRHARARWTERHDGRPVFGPRSPIATRQACDAVGGRFVPGLFGWMVHVDAFAADAAHGDGHSHE